MTDNFWNYALAYTSKKYVQKNIATQIPGIERESVVDKSVDKPIEVYIQRLFSQIGTFEQVHNCVLEPFLLILLSLSFLHFFKLFCVDEV